MSLGLIAALLAALLVFTVATALWRCSHPYRTRYTRRTRRRGRVGIFRRTQRH